MNDCVPLTCVTNLINNPEPLECVNNLELSNYLIKPTDVLDLVDKLNNSENKVETSNDLNLSVNNCEVATCENNPDNSAINPDIVSSVSSVNNSVNIIEMPDQPASANETINFLDCDRYHLPEHVIFSYCAEFIPISSAVEMMFPENIDLFGQLQQQQQQQRQECQQQQQQHHLFKHHQHQHHILVSSNVSNSSNSCYSNNNNYNESTSSGATLDCNSDNNNSNNSPNNLPGPTMQNVFTGMHSELKLISKLLQTVILGNGLKPVNNNSSLDWSNVARGFLTPEKTRIKGHRQATKNVKSQLPNHSTPKSSDVDPLIDVNTTADLEKCAKNTNNFAIALKTSKSEIKPTQIENNINQTLLISAVDKNISSKCINEIYIEGTKEMDYNNNGQNDQFCNKKSSPLEICPDSKNSPHAVGVNPLVTKAIEASFHNNTPIVVGANHLGDKTDTGTIKEDTEATLKKYAPQIGVNPSWTGGIEMSSVQNCPSKVNINTLTATDASKPSQADLDFLKQFCYNYTDLNVPFSTATPTIPTGPEFPKVDDTPLDLSMRITTKPPPGFENIQPNPCLGPIGSISNQLPGVGVSNSEFPYTSIGVTTNSCQPLTSIGLPNTLSLLPCPPVSTSTTVTASLSSIPKTSICSPNSFWKLPTLNPGKTFTEKDKGTELKGIGPKINNFISRTKSSVVDKQQKK